MTNHHFSTQNHEQYANMRNRVASKPIHYPCRSVPEDCRTQSERQVDHRSSDSALEDVQITRGALQNTPPGRLHGREFSLGSRGRSARHACTRLPEGGWRRPCSTVRRYPGRTSRRPREAAARPGAASWCRPHHLMGTEHFPAFRFCNYQLKRFETLPDNTEAYFKLKIFRY